MVAAVAQSQSRLLADLTEQIAAVECELAAVTARGDAWAQSVVRLQTIPGVGLVTAAWLVVATANFTACPTVEAATASAGLAPHPWLSGSSVRGTLQSSPPGLLCAPEGHRESGQSGALCGRPQVTASGPGAGHQAANLRSRVRPTQTGGASRLTNVTVSSCNAGTPPPDRVGEPPPPAPQTPWKTGMLYLIRGGPNCSP